MTRIVAIIILLAIILHKGNAFAAKFETERVQGIFLVRNFNQELGLSFMFNDHEDARNSKMTNQLIERYRFATETVVVDPRFLKLNLSGSVGLTQNKEYSDTQSASGNSDQYQYSLNGVAMEGGMHPISFKSSRTIATIDNTFSPSYTTETNTNGFELSFINDPLTVSLQYEKNSTDVTTSGQTTHTNTDSVTLSGIHAYGERLHSAMTGGFGWQTTSSGGKTETYTLTLSNSLILGKKKNHSLVSTFKGDGQNSSTGIYQRNLEWTEVLHSVLGKSLLADMRYSYISNGTTGINGSNQENSTQFINARLQHQLYRSLQTSVELYGAHSNFLGGYQDRYSGTVGASYVKILPSDSKLALNASETIGMTNRKIAATQQIVRDEQHTVVQQGDSIILGTAGELVSVVRVYRTDPVITDYVDGIDYVVVDTASRVIRITPGGGIAPGTKLLITYILRFDPSTSYISDDLHMSGTLSLLGGRYLVTATLSMSNQNNSNKSQSQNQSLSTQTNSRTASLGFMANLQEHTLGAEVGDNLSGLTESKYIEGSWIYRKAFYASQFSLALRDRYTLYDETAKGRSYPQNTASLSTSYSYYFYWAICSLSANYINNNGGLFGGRRDYIFFRGNIRSQFNKLTLTLTGQTIYRLSNREQTRDDSITMDVTRTF